MKINMNRSRKRDFGHVFQIHLKRSKKKRLLMSTGLQNTVRKGVTLSAKSVCSDAVESKLMSCQVKPPRTKCKHWLLALKREKMITLQLQDRRGEKPHCLSDRKRDYRVAVVLMMMGKRGKKSCSLSLRIHKNVMISRKLRYLANMLTVTFQRNKISI